MKNILLRLVDKYRRITESYITYSRRLGVSIGDNCKLNDIPSWGSEPYLISIGDHVELSNGVSFITHDGATWVFRDEEEYKDVIKYGKIDILDNSFIGMKSTILPGPQGITIGPNSIVGACSLVTKTIPPNTVYAGVPAKFICTLDEYKKKCKEMTPVYDKQRYKQDKKNEVIRVYKNEA